MMSEEIKWHRCRYCGIPFEYIANLEAHERDCPKRPKQFSKFDLTAVECHEFGGIWDGSACSWPTPETELKGKISWLLFAQRPERKNPEILSVVISREKAVHFDFLKAYTKWPARGVWKGEQEANVYFEILFNDTPTEEVGTELMNQLELYREKVLKEKALYAVTVPVEETTLK